MEHASISLALLVYAAAATHLDRARAPAVPRRGVPARRRRGGRAAAAAVPPPLNRPRARAWRGSTTCCGSASSPIAVTLATTALGVAAPRSFAVSLARSASLAFQGVWLVVMGVMLWTPALLPMLWTGTTSCAAAAKAARWRAPRRSSTCSSAGTCPPPWCSSPRSTSGCAVSTRRSRTKVQLVGGNGHGDCGGGGGGGGDVEAAKGGAGHVLGESRTMEISRS
ncbi:hypothetical protein ACP4OV_018111 [Aristida adscensionis]